MTVELDVILLQSKIDIEIATQRSRYFRKKIDFQMKMKFTLTLSRTFFNSQQNFNIGKENFIVKNASYINAF